MAISLEKKAEAFYLTLSIKFSNHPDVSQFWQGMMKDEIYHAQVLQKTLDSLSEETRLLPVDVVGFNYNDSDLKMLSSLCLGQNINNLEDALDIAYTLESSEINSKVTSLAKKFMKPDEMRYFVLLVLEKHVSKLEEFSKSFGDEEIRRGILAKSY